MKSSLCFPKAKSGSGPSTRQQSLLLGSKPVRLHSTLVHTSNVRNSTVARYGGSRDLQVADRAADKSQGSDCQSSTAQHHQASESPEWLRMKSWVQENGGDLSAIGKMLAIRSRHLLNYFIETYVLILGVGLAVGGPTVCLLLLYVCVCLFKR